MKVGAQKRGRKASCQSQVRISKEVKKAISRFIRRTEKIVRSVSPQAQIVVPKHTCTEKKPQKDTETPSVISKSETKTQIPIPQFRGTALDR